MKGFERIDPKILAAFAVYRHMGPTYRRKDQTPLKAALDELIAVRRLEREFRKARKNRAKAAVLYAELETFVDVWNRFTPRGPQKPGNSINEKGGSRNERSRPDRTPDARS